MLLFYTDTNALQGSNMLATLLTHPKVTQVATYTRRSVPSSQDPDRKLQAYESTETSSWPTKLQSTSPPPTIFFSGLGTTRGQAGSLEKQRLIDYDLNLSMARAASAAGTRVYVLVSTGMASASSAFPYTRMKGELEDAVRELDFEKVVILRPGLIVGAREDSRPPEAAFRWIARALGALNQKYLKDTWAQDASVIARAGVKAGMMCVEGTAPEGKTWVLDQGDIVRLGGTEWKE